MDLQLQSPEGAAGTVTVPGTVFDAAYNEALIHQLVTAYQAGARAGTKAQKSRSQVKGGGAKPWRQKGTGRARAGTSNSPIWRSGGATFAASPRNYTQKLNRKMYRAGMRSILSELVRTERLVLVEGFSVDSPKTSALKEQIGAYGLDGVVIVVGEMEENLYLAARNLRKVDVLEASEVNPVDLIGFEKVLMTRAAVEKIGEQLA